MLYAFDLNLKWLPDTVVKEVNEKVEMLVRQDEASIFDYHRILLSLAAGDLNPGRFLMIQFFSDSVKEHLVKKICGMSQSEYRNQGWIRWLRTLFTEQSIAYRRLIRGINHVNGVCLTSNPSTLAGRRKSDGGKRNFVTFNPEIVVHLIPYEDRRRAHFQRRIQLFEELFTAL